MRKSLFFVCCLCAAFFFSGSRSALADTSAVDIQDYEAVVYDTTDGMASEETNAIAQTGDGYMWAGTYAGLYRYDGHKFEQMGGEEGIANVMTLYVDSKGLLWVGTNDSGLYSYDYTTGEVEVYDEDCGLNGLSVRSICEDSKGQIFVGTVSGLNVIGTDGSVAYYSEFEELNNISSLDVLPDDTVVGVSNSGIFFGIKNDGLVFRYICEENGVYFTDLAADYNGSVYVGTSTSIVYRYSMNSKGMVLQQEYDFFDCGYFNYMWCDNETGKCYCCSEDGMGYINSADDSIVSLNRNSFNASITGVMKDYQDNIWFCSSKQGILKLSENAFLNVTAKAGVVDAVVNAVHLKGNLLYVACDSGLIIINRKNYTIVENDLTESLYGMRTRHILEDSEGNMWFSTYGEVGLLEYKADGTIVTYNEVDGTMGGRFRLCLELSDGTILAASNMGLSYIQNEKVVDTIGEKEGFVVPQMLTMVECSDGSILAGSDGDGIYKIKDGEIVDLVGPSKG
ncbi:MAG: hypothetical protein K5840_03885, partial [Eubacterium sp.]|nr:hypothetical protein [Eubacterium sp.]